MRDMLENSAQVPFGRDSSDKPAFVQAGVPTA